MRTEPFERGSGPIDLRPVILSPTRADFVPHHWLSANREFLEAELLSRGAVVLRGFGASTVSRFEALVAAMGARLSTDNGELPRLRLGDHAFTAVDYPASERIHWHNENAFYRRWPGNIWFGCLQAARSGGATPIVDGRSMLETLPAWIVERLSRVRLVYVRNYRHGLGLPWSEVFAANTRCEVESKCAALGVECEWLDDGLRTRSVRPAVVRHPRTGELVWFNQITHWHPCCLPPELRRTLESHYRPEDMPRSVHFEDGSPIPERMVEQICAAYRALEVASPWRVGDMLVIDNMLVSHARESFEGPRKLAIAMGNMVHEDQLVAPASTANGGRG